MYRWRAYSNKLKRIIHAAKKNVFSEQSNVGRMTAYPSKYGTAFTTLIFDVLTMPSRTQQY